MTANPCPPCGQPFVPVSDPGLTYDPADDTYWFDHAGLRYRFRCRRSGYPADPGVSLEEMARITMAIRNGHVQTMPAGNG